MIFIQTPLPGARLIDLERRGDERGFFARTFCAREFAAEGLKAEFVQANTSWTSQQGTLRGMHYQLAPASEVKLVRCTRGAIWDAILDLRVDSPTFGKSFGAELTAENRRAIYVPEGFAHGFLTLVPDTEVFYMVSAYYSPDLERGVRWNDPEFSIEWPFLPDTVSARDRAHPDFNVKRHREESGS